MTEDRNLTIVCELKDVKFEFEYCDLYEFAIKKHLKVDWKNPIAITNLTDKFQKYIDKEESDDGKGTYTVSFPASDEKLSFVNLNVGIISKTGHKLKSFDKLTLIRAFDSPLGYDIDNPHPVYHYRKEFNKVLIDRYTDESTFNRNLKERITFN